MIRFKGCAQEIKKKLARSKLGWREDDYTGMGFSVIVVEKLKLPSGGVRIKGITVPLD